MAVMLKINNNVWRVGFPFQVQGHFDFDVDEMRSRNASCKRGEYPLNSVSFSIMAHKFDASILDFFHDVVNSDRVRKIYTDELPPQNSMVLEFQSESDEMLALLQYGQYVETITNLQ